MPEKVAHPPKFRGDSGRVAASIATPGQPVNNGTSYRRLVEDFTRG